MKRNYLGAYGYRNPTIFLGGSKDRVPTFSGLLVWYFGFRGTCHKLRMQSQSVLGAIAGMPSQNHNTDSKYGNV